MNNPNVCLRNALKIVKNKLKLDSKNSLTKMPYRKQVRAKSKIALPIQNKTIIQKTFIRISISSLHSSHLYSE